MLKRTIVVLAVMSMVAAIMPAAIAAATGDIDTYEVTVTKGAAKVQSATVIIDTTLNSGATNSQTLPITDANGFVASSADVVDYDGSAPGDTPLEGASAWVRVTENGGDDTYWFAVTLSEAGNTGIAEITVDLPLATEASVSGYTVEDAQAKGTTGDNVYTASDTKVSETKITIYKSGVAYANTTTDANGSWTTILGAGTYTVKADITSSTTVVAAGSNFTDWDKCDTPDNCPASPTTAELDEGEVQWFGGSGTSAGATSITVGSTNLTGADIVYDNDSAVDATRWDHMDVATGAFTDTVGHWANTAISVLKTQSVVTGTTATTFSPEADITRAEFAVMLSRMMNNGAVVVSTAPFSDVPTSHWAAPEIQQLKTAKVVSGTTATTFNPEAAISRAEAVEMIARAALLDGDAPKVGTWTATPAGVVAANAAPTATLGTEDLAAATLSFVDVPTTHWAARSIAWMVDADVVKGQADGSFGPTDNLTRAEMATLLYRAVGSP